MSEFALPFLWSIELKDWLADEVYKSVSAGREQWFGSVHFSGPCDLKVLSAVLGSNTDRLTHRNTHTHTHLNAQSEHTLHKTTPPGKRYRTNLSRSCQASQTCTNVCVWQEALIMSPMPQEIFLSLALSCFIVHTFKLPSIHPSHQQTLLQWRSTTMSFDLFKSPTNQQ